MAKQPNLFEYDYAKKVAMGMTQRDAYMSAFGVVATLQSEIASVDRKASKLKSRPDIASLIEAEANYNRLHIDSVDRETNLQIKRGLQATLLAAINGGDALKVSTLRGIELLSKLTGAFAPEEHTIRNGGVSEDYKPVPKGVQSMDQAVLDKFLLDRIQGAPGAESSIEEGKNVGASATSLTTGK